MKHKIGIIGSGHIGENVGKNLVKAGHQVMFSSRHPEELKSMADEVGAEVGTVEEAAQYGDIILLATPFGANPTVANNTKGLDGKIIIDATNPYPGRDGEVAQQVIDDPNQTSTGYVAGLFPEAHLVKAFNATYYAKLRDDAFLEGDQRLAVPIAGDHAAAKNTVIELLESMNYAPLDFGGLENSTQFEPDAEFYNVNLPVGEARPKFNAWQDE